MPTSEACAQDTGDTRETPAIDVCHGLMADGAALRVYDPQVKQEQIYRRVPCSRLLRLSPHVSAAPGPSTSIPSSALAAG